MATWTSDGRTSLAEAAALHKTSPGTILRLTTAQASGTGALPPGVAEWLAAVFTGSASPVAPVPAGITFRVPGHEARR